MVNDFHLQQFVQESTRDNHTLDLIFCSDPSRLTSVTVTPGLSDHEAILFVSILSLYGIKNPTTISICTKEEIDKNKRLHGKFSASFLIHRTII